MLSLLLLAGFALANRRERRRAARHFANLRSTLLAAHASARLSVASYPAGGVVDGVRREGFVPLPVLTQFGAPVETLATIEAKRLALRETEGRTRKQLHYAKTSSPQFSRLLAELQAIRGELKDLDQKVADKLRDSLVVEVPTPTLSAHFAKVLDETVNQRGPLVPNNVDEPVRSILLDSVPLGGRGKQLNDLRAYHGLRPLTRREIGAEADASPGFWEFLDNQTQKVETEATLERWAALARFDKASGFVCGLDCTCDKRCRKPLD